MLLQLLLLLCICLRQWQRQRQLGPSHNAAAADSRLHTTTNGARCRLSSIPRSCSCSRGSAAAAAATGLRPTTAAWPCATSIAASRLIGRRLTTRMAAARGQWHYRVATLMAIPFMRMCVMMM